MKLSVAILISGSGSNMVQLIKSMDHEHPAFPSIVISNKSDSCDVTKNDFFINLLIRRQPNGQAISVFLEGFQF